MPHDTKGKGKKRKADQEEENGAESRARAASMARAGEVGSLWRSEVQSLRDREAQESEEQTLKLLSGEGSAATGVRLVFLVPRLRQAVTCDGGLGAGSVDAAAKGRDGENRAGNEKQRGREKIVEWR